MPHGGLEEEDYKGKGCAKKTFELFRLILSYGAMGRKSKSKSRIQNLSRTTSTSQSQEACTDDIECDSEDHFVPPQPFKFIVFDAYDSESDSDYNSDDGNSSDDGFDSDEEDKEDHEDVKIDADLLRFATILSEAQAVAIKTSKWNLMERNFSQNEASITPEVQHAPNGFMRKSDAHFKLKDRNLLAIGSQLKRQSFPFHRTWKIFPQPAYRVLILNQMRKRKPLTLK